MSNAVVNIENLGKKYRVGHQRSKGDGMRHTIESAIRSPLQWVRSRRKTIEYAEFWALRDVSLSIARGEVIGVIGRNGAGKSTLLKLLSRITVPTEGRIAIEGRVASLLEVGTGFHQELTGRENIFLNGAILGMSRAEIRRKFDEIVEFSEIEDFLDTPVKRYSSGMYVRLAFAVAAHLEPEILIVDEVLAVGDAAFQKKSLGKMGSIANSGRTVVFVSHNMEAVRSLCSRGVWLKDGHVHKDGEIDEVADEYFNSTASNISFTCSNADLGITINGVVLRKELGQESYQFRPGDDLIVEIHYEAKQTIEKPHFILAIQGLNGTCFTANMLLDGQRPKILSGSGKLSCRFKSIPLFPQNYSVKMSARTRNGNDVIFDYKEIAYFNVVGDLAEYGFKGEFVSRASRSTPVIVPYEWWLPDGSIAFVSLERNGR